MIDDLIIPVLVSILVAVLIRLIGKCLSKRIGRRFLEVHDSWKKSENIASYVPFHQALGGSEHLFLIAIGYYPILALEVVEKTLHLILSRSLP